MVIFFNKYHVKYYNYLINNKKRSRSYYKIITIMSTKIQNILPRLILDSRGYPTVEVEMILSDQTTVRASVPSGASIGEKEAIELRDGQPEWNGKGVQQAIENINKHIKPAIIGKSPFDIINIDKTMIELDGTQNKKKLGANAILAVSLANIKAGAAHNKQKLFEYIYLHQKNQKPTLNKYIMPRPMMNILNGGNHADNNIDIQEFMIVPKNFSSYSEALRAGVEIFHSLRTILKKHKYNISVGDEGGFAPTLRDNEEAIELILEAIIKANYKPEKEISLALDVAASELYSKKQKIYYLKSEEKKYSSLELIEYYQKLCIQYPIISIEDGLDQNDWTHWEILKNRLGKTVQIVGDDLTVTNPKLLQKALELNCINAILIKPNQIGTFSETLQTIKLAQKNKLGVIISHRSGETEDTTIADLAVATGAGQIKTGSPCRTDRNAKYNQLLRIEDYLGERTKYANNQFFQK